MLLTTFLFLYLSTTILCKPLDGSARNETACGYNSCHKTFADKLNVHLVAHSHDDLGWQKTVDQYFYGNRIKLHPGVRGVQNILDTVVQALLDNPDRRFIQVETAFFARWWEQQSDDIKESVKSLVDNGQLEMVSGGWSMNDEATTNYQSIIDQFTLGLRTLKDFLGECAVPRVGWQIDPFGHSNAMATIFAQLGFDGLFFTRLDYRDVLKRHETNTSEFIWRGNSDLGEESDIFTSLIYRFYNAPDYFCWDVQCNDLPIIDDKNSFDYNLDDRVKNFTEYIYQQANKYATNNILITMGGDFTYQAAHMYYTNIDKLIKGFQDNEDINIIYSTPSCYIKAVNEASKAKAMTFSLKTDDFLPYASDAHSYWTGFYSSRPTLKRMEKLGNNLLQVAKQLTVQANAYKKHFNDDLTELKSVMGIMQHHDAITGTEQEHVARDYTYLLTKAIKNAEKNVHTMIFDVLKIQKEVNDEGVDLHSCLVSNITRCPQSNSKRFTVAVYNPGSHVVSHYVRLPVVSINYSVQRVTGNTVPHQISPSIDTFDDVPESKSLYELTFYAESIPPLGVKYFYVTKNDDDENTPGLIKPIQKDFIGTDATGFGIDEKGFVDEVRIDGRSQTVRQEFLYYKSTNGTNIEPENRASGAYIFRPVESTKAVPVSDTAAYEVYSGELFDELHQKFNDWLKQVIRVYKNESYIEFDWIVGPAEYIDKLGIEVITRFTTRLNNTDVFYTDSNGRELVKRVRDHRDTFDFTDEEPISGNYYPVTSRIMLRDEHVKEDFVIFNDRSQGGSSLATGEIELMIHRRLMNDDNFGVNEVLNEREFNRGIKIRGQHFLYFAESNDDSAAQQHKIMQKTALAPWVFIGNATDEKYSLSNLMTKTYFEFSGITSPLPENVRILTLELLSNVTILLRLEHLYGGNESTLLSQPAQVDLKNLLTLYNVLSFEETTLGSNQLKKDNEKLSWTLNQQQRVERDESSTITLNPMEIRTFVLTVEIKTSTGGSYTNFPRVFIIVLSVLLLLY